MNQSNIGKSVRGKKGLISIIYAHTAYTEDKRGTSQDQKKYIWYLLKVIITLKYQKQSNLKPLTVTSFIKDHNIILRIQRCAIQKLKFPFTTTYL